MSPDRLGAEVDGRSSIGPVRHSGGRFAIKILPEAFRRWGRSSRVRFDRRAPLACLNTGIGADLGLDLKAVARHVEGARESVRSPDSGEQPLSERRESGPTQSTTKRRTKRSVDSVAVLPLENLSRDENLDYLTDGLTESLINNLSRLPRLKVMARSTVFRYKGRQIDRRRSVRASASGPY